MDDSPTPTVYPSKTSEGGDIADVPPAPLFRPFTIAGENPGPRYVEL